MVTKMFSWFLCLSQLRPVPACFLLLGPLPYVSEGSKSLTSTLDCAGTALEKNICPEAVSFLPLDSFSCPFSLPLSSFPWRLTKHARELPQYPFLSFSADFIMRTFPEDGVWLSLCVDHSSGRATFSPYLPHPQLQSGFSVLVPPFPVCVGLRCKTQRTGAS